MMTIVKTLRKRVEIIPWLEIHVGPSVRHPMVHAPASLWMGQGWYVKVLYEVLTPGTLPYTHYCEVAFDNPESATLFLLTWA
jgi:hypothetical protein